jgi:hypothetical protein
MRNAKSALAGEPFAEFVTTLAPLNVHIHGHQRNVDARLSVLKRSAHHKLTHDDSSNTFITPDVVADVESSSAHKQTEDSSNNS